MEHSKDGCDPHEKLEPRQAVGAVSLRKISTFWRTTSLVGLSREAVGTRAMFFTTSIPAITVPKTECLLSRCGVARSVMKNCEPLVAGPELAIESTPGPECRSSG